MVYTETESSSVHTLWLYNRFKKYAIERAYCIKMTSHTTSVLQKNFT